MDGGAVKKRAKTTTVLPPAISRIVHENSDDSAVDMCVDLFNRLVQNSASPDRQNYFGLVYVAKVRPSLFRRPQTLSVLKNFLVNAKSLDTVLCLLCCNLLLRGFKDVAEWPLEFVQVYLMDSFRDRVWVDHDLAAKFVAGVSSAFSSNPNASPNCRYHDAQARAKLRQVTVHLVREHLDRTNNVQGLVRALAPLCTYDECRQMAAAKMVASSWLQDAHLGDRYAKSLFEALCKNVSTDSQYDLDALKHLLILQPGTQQTPSFINEQRSRLLSNNPRYPEFALRVTLTASDETFSVDALLCAVGSFPSELQAARVIGHALGSMCSTLADSHAERSAARILRHLPKVNRHELVTGLLESGQATAPTLTQFSNVFSQICPPADAEPLIGAYMLVVARLVNDATPFLRTLKQHLETSILPRLQYINDGILEALIVLAEKWEEFRPVIPKLIAAVPRAKIGGGAAPLQYVQRLLNISDVLSVVLLAIWAPLQCGRVALESEEVRVSVASVVTGAENRYLAPLSVSTRAQMQAEAQKSRDPDYLVLALRMYPQALDTCPPPWLEKITMEDVGVLSGMGPELSLRLLITILALGPRHPLYQHRERLAAQVTDVSISTLAAALDKLGHPRLATREAAYHTLGLVLGPQWWEHSLWSQQGSRQKLQEVAQKIFEVETDKKRIDVFAQLSGVSPSSMPHVMKRRVFRSFVPATGMIQPSPTTTSARGRDWATVLAQPAGLVAPTPALSRPAEPLPLTAVKFTPTDMKRRRALDVQFATATEGTVPRAATVGVSSTLSPEQVVRNASQSLLANSSFSYLAERLKARYSPANHATLEHHFHVSGEIPLYVFDFCSADRNSNYERVFANCGAVLKDEATADLVIHEWMNAASHSDPSVVADARAHASGLYICLSTARQRDRVREFIVDRAGPQVAADFLRAFLVASGYC